MDTVDLISEVIHEIVCCMFESVDGGRGSSRPLTFDQSTFELLRLLVIALVSIRSTAPACSSVGTSAGGTRRPVQLAYGAYDRITRDDGCWL